MVFALLSVIKYQELEEKLSPSIDNEDQFQAQEEEMPSTPTIEHMSGPSLTEHSSG
jgi:hypothetical protein